MHFNKHNAGKKNETKRKSRLTHSFDTDKSTSRRELQNRPEVLNPKVSRLSDSVRFERRYQCQDAPRRYDGRTTSLSVDNSPSYWKYPTIPQRYFFNAHAQ